MFGGLSFPCLWNFQFLNNHWRLSYEVNRGSKEVEIGPSRDLTESMPSV